MQRPKHMTSAQKWFNVGLRCRRWNNNKPVLGKCIVLADSTIRTDGLNIAIYINPEIFSHKPWGPKGFFQFEISLNVSVRSFCFISMPMLWVYGHYKYFYAYSAEIDFRRQNVTPTDVRF